MRHTHKLRFSDHNNFSKRNKAWLCLFSPPPLIKPINFPCFPLSCSSLTHYLMLSCPLWRGFNKGLCPSPGSPDGCVVIPQCSGAANTLNISCSVPLLHSLSSLPFQDLLSHIPTMKLDVICPSLMELLSYITFTVVDHKAQQWAAMGHVQRWCCPIWLLRINCSSKCVIQ